MKYNKIIDVPSPHICKCFILQTNKNNSWPLKSNGWLDKQTIDSTVKSIDLFNPVKIFLWNHLKKTQSIWTKPSRKNRVPRIHGFQCWFPNFLLYLTKYRLLTVATKHSQRNAWNVSMSNFFKNRHKVFLIPSSIYQQNNVIRWCRWASQ